MSKLYDEDLKGVDPHDPNLTKEYKLKIIIESQKNPWYFIREVMRIPVPEYQEILCNLNNFRDEDMNKQNCILT